MCYALCRLISNLKSAMSNSRICNKLIELKRTLTCCCSGNDVSIWHSRHRSLRSRRSLSLQRRTDQRIRCKGCNDFRWTDDRWTTLNKIKFSLWEPNTFGSSYPNNLHTETPIDVSLSEQILSQQVWDTMPPGPMAPPLFGYWGNSVSKFW